MTIAAWPPGLPALVGQVGSLGSPQLYEPPKTTAMDDGPGRTRTRVLTNETTRTITLTLKRAEFELFLGFVRDTLNKGARRFTAPVRLPSGRIGTRTCRIEGPVPDDDRGPHVVVSFKLRVYDW